jgi:preprotein translocase subunit SecF
MPLNNEIKGKFGIVSNYLDVALILIVLLIFCASAQKRIAIYISLGVFLLFEIFVGSIFRFTRESLTYILGPGLLLIFCWAVILFAQHVKLSIEKNKGFGKTFMITSILFAYGCYMMIYYFYYIQKTNDVRDVLLIYYIVSIISSMLMAVGLILVYKKTRQIKEVQTTRKELAVFFQR